MATHLQVDYAGASEDKTVEDEEGWRAESNQGIELPHAEDSKGSS